MLSIWEQLGSENIQVSATYVARMVALDSAIAVVEPAPVQTRAFTAGQRQT